MNTLYDLGKAVEQMRDVANQLEVKGRNNTAGITFIVDTCNNIIKTINEVAAQQQKAQEAENQNGISSVEVSDNANYIGSPNAD